MSNPNPSDTIPNYFDIPKKCKAGVVVNPGPNFHVEVEEVDVPEPGPDDVLIRLNATGLCYSDIHFMLGDITGIPPMSTWGIRSPGHEGAGTVVKVGSNVKNWKVGDRAGIKPIWDTCHKCENCWSDKETYCPQAIQTGLMVPGTYQQYVTSPARYTAPIPAGVSDYVAAPAMCSAATMFASLAATNLRPRDFAVFLGGGGGVGIQGVQLAKVLGYRPIVVDTGADKKKLATDMGAEAFFDFAQLTRDELIAAVVAHCGGVGAHAVFVTAPAAYEYAVPLTGARVGAYVMCVGLPSSSDCVVSGTPKDFVFRNLTVRGTLVGNMYEIGRTLALAESQQLRSVAVEVFGINEIGAAVEKLKSGKVTAGRIVVDFNK